MLEFETAKKVKPHISIAPLIDCVFQLLIFFLLSSYFIIQPGIKITLPEAETSQPQEEEITVFITENNEIFLGEQKIGINELKDSLDERLKTSQKKTVILKADEKINLGLAVKVMDIAKQAEAEGLVISTRIEPQRTDIQKHKHVK